MNSSTKTCCLSTKNDRINHVIRLISVTDLDAVLEIERDCYPSPWSFQQFLQELENPVATVLVCEAKNEIGGYICYWLIAGEMQILNLAISPQMRRHGLAAQLLVQAFEYCLSSGLSSAWLEVRSGNRAAITLYQHHGFKINGTRRAYYRDGEDALLMVKTFSDQEPQERI